MDKRIITNIKEINIEEYYEKLKKVKLKSFTNKLTHLNECGVITDDVEIPELKLKDYNGFDTVNENQMLKVIVFGLLNKVNELEEKINLKRKSRE